jgi:chemotaxis protein MotB
LARRVRDLGEESGHSGGGPLRWLLTYADMITLLMAFFVMLYSMSVVNMGRFRQVAGSIRSGFGAADGVSNPGNPSGFGADGPQLKDGVAGVPWSAVQKIEKKVRASGLDKYVKFRADERGLVISLATDKVLFPKGQADLSPRALQIIDAVADAVRGIPNQISVEGHTCDLPVASEKYPSNWELSTSRATSVVRYLVEQGWISSERLSAAGYADSKPLVPNTSENNRARNRRVDIVILNLQER